VVKLLWIALKVQPKKLRILPFITQAFGDVLVSVIFINLLKPIK